MTTDRNRTDESAKATASEALGTLLATPCGDFLGVSWNAPQDIYNGQAIYTTPPATIPVGDVQALVERLRNEVEQLRASTRFMSRDEAMPVQDIAKAKSTVADELAALARKYEPTTPKESPSPRNP